MWKQPNSVRPKKQLRKPINANFEPKRLAISFDPPMIILEYLVVDTGKLYHHKMRLDSVLKRTNCSRTDVMNYVKNKHHLYFMNGKVKDEQLFRLIDRILLQKNKNKPALNSIEQKNESSPQQGKDDFDYLDEEEEYEEDYEDYEEPEPQQKPPTPGKKQPVFLTYGQDDEWDLDMDENADFV